MIVLFVVEWLKLCVFKVDNNQEAGLGKYIVDFGENNESDGSLIGKR